MHFRLFFVVAQILMLSFALFSKTAESKGITSSTYRGGGYRSYKSGAYSRRVTYTFAPYWRPRGTYYYGHRTRSSSCRLCPSRGGLCYDDGTCYSSMLSCNVRCSSLCGSPSGCSSYTPRTASFTSDSSVPLDNLRCRRDVDVFLVPVDNGTAVSRFYSTIALLDGNGYPIDFAPSTTYEGVTAAWNQLMLPSVRYCYDDNSIDIYSTSNTLLKDMIRDLVVWRFNGVTRNGLTNEVVPPTINMFLRKDIYDSLVAWSVTVRFLGINLYTKSGIYKASFLAVKDVTFDNTTNLYYKRSLVDSTRLRTVGSMWSFTATHSLNATMPAILGNIRLECSVPDDMAQSTLIPPRFYRSDTLTCDFITTIVSANPTNIPSNSSGNVTIDFELTSPPQLQKVSVVREDSDIEDDRDDDEDGEPDGALDNTATTLDPLSMDRIEIGSAADKVKSDATLIAFDVATARMYPLLRYPIDVWPETATGDIDFNAAKQTKSVANDEDPTRDIQRFQLYAPWINNGQDHQVTMFVTWNDPNAYMDLSGSVGGGSAGGVFVKLLMVTVVLLFLV